MNNQLTHQSSDSPMGDNSFVWYEISWEKYLYYREEVRQRWPERSVEENLAASRLCAPRNYQSKKDFEKDAEQMRANGCIDCSLSSKGMETYRNFPYGPCSKRKYRGWNPYK